MTLAMRRAKREARKTVLEGVPLRGSRQAAQRAPAPGRAPWAAQYVLPQRGQLPVASASQA